MARIGTLPIDCDLTHGDLNLGTITLDIPLKAGDPETVADGTRYVTVSPDFTDGWFERALTAVVATLPDDAMTEAVVRECKAGQ